MDFSKWKYEEAIKAKKARKNQTTVQVKEIKFRPKIDVHDYETKKKHVIRFIDAGAKVKVTIMFRGLEMSHPERGRALLERLAEDVSELGVIESAPIQDGRNMVMLLAPVRELPKTDEPGAKPDGAKPEAPAVSKPRETAETETTSGSTPEPGSPGTT